MGGHATSPTGASVSFLDGSLEEHREFEFSPVVILRLSCLAASSWVLVVVRDFTHRSSHLSGGRAKSRRCERCHCQMTLSGVSTRSPPVRFLGLRV